MLHFDANLGFCIMMNEFEDTYFASKIENGNNFDA